MAILQRPEDVGRDLVARALTSAFADASLSVVRDAIAVNLGTSDQPGWAERIVEEAPSRTAGSPGSSRSRRCRAARRQIAHTAKSLAESVVDRDLLRLKREAVGALSRVDQQAEPARFHAIQERIVRLDRERSVYRGE